MADTHTVGSAGYDWRAGLLTGIVAGLAFLFVWMALSPIAGGSVWLPYQMIGAIVLGPEALPPPGGFEFITVAAALVVHFVLSIVYASILGLFIRGRSMTACLGVGALFGVLLYLINFYVFTGVFPWFALVRNWAALVTHIAFGAVAGVGYAWIAGRVGPREAVSAA